MVAEKMRYLCYQREIAPDTKKEHWQGYVEFEKPHRIPGAKNHLGDAKMHLEARKGPRDAARDYCRKPDSAVADTFKEFGEWHENQQGKRTDLSDAIACGNMEDIKDKFPEVYVKYHRGLEKLILPPKRNKKPHVWVIWSEKTGTGKSLTAHQFAGKFGFSSYTKVPGKWWQDYKNEDVVIIDDFETQSKDWEGWNATYLLRLLDRYPFKVEWKGGGTEFTSPYIIITSHFNPRGWFPGRWPELERRIDAIDCYENNVIRPEDIDNPDHRELPAETPPLSEIAQMDQFLDWASKDLDSKSTDPY